MRTSVIAVGLLALLFQHAIVQVSYASDSEELTRTNVSEAEQDVAPTEETDAPLASAAPSAKKTTRRTKAGALRKAGLTSLVVVSILTTVALLFAYALHPPARIPPSVVAMLRPLKHSFLTGAGLTSLAVTSVLTAAGLSFDYASRHPRGTRPSHVQSIMSRSHTGSTGSDSPAAPRGTSRT
ncbi:hypothetical protein BESB_052820 [Besnoitia besnoiti]|uniref:Transmembrane protein n=1 Tax=Besnoitia besnoiti TaxID=94643 RepID=A0A2A9MH92_BESBE|nr:hypothetical protein BESB_052820 [Besnoitia besnoiti]PFH35631.1 hypothetical protein BESB_052820 [Besnoitia besnoiti]